ncbi:sensor histidine kinase [Aquimarina sp. AU58]|uniref:sensor histidine kinase n=1 Tax=Aquimarina sp. AU58 TaxID=1874112 RepID=UPI000D658F93|nr:sensor histidine kinase [Aquimarina sp. AU58]
MKIKVKKIIVSIFTTCCCLSFNYESINRITEALIGLQFDNTDTIINQLSKKKGKIEFRVLTQIMYHKGQEKSKDSIATNSLKAPNTNTQRLILYHLIQAYYFLYNDHEDSSAFSNFYEAYVLSKEENNTNLLKLSILGFLQYYSKEIVQSSDSYSKYLEELRKLSENVHDQSWVYYYDNYFKLNSLYDDHGYIKTSKELIKFIKKNNNLSIGITSQYKLHIGLYYKLNEKNKIAKTYFNDILNTPDYPFLNKIKFTASLYLADINAKNKKFDIAKRYISISSKYMNKSDTLTSLFESERFKSVYYYERIPKYDSAYFNLKSSTLREAQLNIKKNTLKISELNVQLQTTEKEKEIVQLLNTNLKTEASRVQNRNLLIGSLSLILVGSIFVFLVYKNIKRKQRIAKQEREIEIQKTEKLLKEQELTAIDAMISGQEKERQRLANELHDNLGSTLATVKLHFQHLQHNKDNPKVEHVAELYTKTNALLDEAYQKVRTIAHEKNSGVMANQGLLLAIKNLAKQVSNGDGLHIEIQDYGLEERLDNTLEISIFRMIQELITNSIKHAAASEIHISLTNHDSLLNIIIEDNGKGFDAKVLPKKEGMGLRNIEKRVEHLEGTFAIDSTIGKGTNIIINIPI